MSTKRACKISADSTKNSHMIITESQICQSCDMCDKKIHCCKTHGTDSCRNHLCSNCSRCIDEVTDEELKHNIENFLMGNII